MLVVMQVLQFVNVFRILLGIIVSYLGFNLVVGREVFISLVHSGE